MHVESALALLLFFFSFDLIRWLITTSVAFLKGPPKVEQGRAKDNGEVDAHHWESYCEPPDGTSITQPALNHNLFMSLIRGSWFVIYCTKHDKASDNHDKRNYIGYVNAFVKFLVDLALLKFLLFHFCRLSRVHYIHILVDDAGLLARNPIDICVPPL